MRSLLEVLEIDRGHPFSFTRRRLEAALESHGLRIRRRKRAGYWRTWLEELVSGSVKQTARALLFATRDRTVYVLEK